jgi:hypothetical protein
MQCPSNSVAAGTHLPHRNQLYSRPSTDLASPRRATSSPSLLLWPDRCPGEVNLPPLYLLQART